MIYFLALLLFPSQSTSKDWYTFSVANLESDQIDSFKRMIETFLLNEVQSGDVVTFLDAKTEKQVFEIRISDRIKGKAPRMRAQLMFRLHPELKRLGPFFATIGNRSFKPNILRFLRSHSLQRYSGFKKHLIWIGSPVPEQKSSILNSFHNAYPNDKSFECEESLFYTGGLNQRLKGVNVYVVHSSDLHEYTEVDSFRDFHYRKMRRALTLFIQHGGGQLVLYSGSLGDLMTLKTGFYPPIQVDPLDKTQTKPRTIELVSMTSPQGKTLDKRIWEFSGSNPLPLFIDDPETETKGAFQIGIRYKVPPDNADVDLDLYTELIGDIPISYHTLGNKPSKYGGMIVKDYSKTTLKSFGHESILYASEEADLRLLKPILINHYSGHTTYPIQGEVIVQRGDAIYKKEFQFKSRKGNYGQGKGDESCPQWIKLDVREIVGTPSGTLLTPPKDPRIRRVQGGKTLENESKKPETPSAPVDLQGARNRGPLSPGHEKPLLRSSTLEEFWKDEIPQEGADVVILLDTSGSMLSSPKDGIWNQIKTLWGSEDSPSKLDVAATSILRLFKQYPKNRYRVGSYSLSCTFPARLMDSAAYKGRSSLAVVNHENLHVTLREAGVYFKGSTAPSRKILILGDLDDGCDQTLNLCDLVEDLESQGIEVRFYFFAVHDYYFQSYPCLSDHGISILPGS